MKEFEHKFLLKHSMNGCSQLFEFVELEMRRLIIKNHWMKFVENVKNF